MISALASIEFFSFIYFSLRGLPHFKLMDPGVSRTSREQAPMNLEIYVRLKGRAKSPRIVIIFRIQIEKDTLNSHRDFQIRFFNVIYFLLDTVVFPTFLLGFLSCELSRYALFRPSLLVHIIISIYFLYAYFCIFHPTRTSHVTRLFSKFNMNL